MEILIFVNMVGNANNQHILMIDYRKTTVRSFQGKF